MANQGGNLKSTSINGCKTYYITGQRSNATWLDPKKIRALRKDTDYQQRVELVQDLRFETATTRIKVSPEGEFLIASGIYPPQVKVYELREMALKFERHLISEIVDFEVHSFAQTKGLDFVVFEQPEVTILTGHVEGDDLEELQSHLFVKVKSASDPSKIAKVLQLSLSNFFQIRDLPRAKHILQLQYSARSSILKFESSPIEVDLEKQSHFHIGPIRCTVKVDYQKQELTSTPLLPLIVGLSAVTLVISMPGLKDLYQSSIFSSGSSIKKEMRKPIIKKRTY